MRKKQFAVQSWLGSTSIRLVAFIAVLVFLPSAGHASCSVDAPDHSSEFELEVWHGLCESGSYDGVVAEEFSDGVIVENCRSPNSLSSDFLSTILTNPTFYNALPSRSISLTCANIEAVTLPNKSIPLSVRFSRLTIFGDVELRDSRIDGNLDFQDVVLGGNFTADRARVEGFLSFSDSDLGDVDMHDLRIKSHLSFYNSIVSSINASSTQISSYFYVEGTEIDGTFNARNARVERIIVLNSSEFFGEVNLIDASAKMGLVGTDAIFHEDVEAIRFTTSSVLSFRRSVFESDGDFRLAQADGEVRFNGAKVQGDLNFRGSVFADIAYFDDGEFQAINLGTTENDHITFFGTTIHEKLNLSYSNNTGIHFATRDDDGIRLTIWGENSEFDLTETDVELLAANFPSSFTRSDGSALPINLSSVDIETFRLVEPETTSNLTATSPEDIVAWIVSSNEAMEAESVPPRNYFSTRPFEQLESWYRRIGDHESARRVTFEKMSERTRALPHSFNGWLQRLFWYWPLKAVVGFGAYPWWAILWFLGLVAAGWGVGYRWGGQKPNSGWFWCRYSFDNAIPLLETSAEARNFKLQNGYLWGWFLVQKVLGFILVSILIGSITFQ